MNVVAAQPEIDVTVASPDGVLPGFKRTEAGVIPEDWETAALETLCMPGGLVRGPFGGSLTKEMFVRTGKKVYEQRNAIHRSAVEGSYFIPEAKYRAMERFAVEPGDFIVSCSGTIGKIFRIPRDARAGVINQALLKLVTNDTVVDANYFYHYFDWEDFQQRIIENTHGGAMQNLVGMDQFRAIEFPLPPLPEQRAIAAALSDVDALIGALDKLVAKKRAIKQGAMQQLLTGKTRLPGFSGDWEVAKFGSLFQFLSTANNARADLSKFGNVGYIHYGDIHTSSGTFLDCAVTSLPLIEESKVTNVSVVEDGDLVMVDASEDYEGIGKCVEIRNATDRKIVAGLHTFLLRGDRALIADGFKGYLQFIPSVKAALIRLATGISVYGVSKSNVQSIEVWLPPVSEQRAIAAVLSDMDAEIAALEARREKTRAIKQGMMQELLTGRIRLGRDDGD